jgi:hypothetical protein
MLGNKLASDHLRCLTLYNDMDESANLFFLARLKLWKFDKSFRFILKSEVNHETFSFF